MKRILVILTVIGTLCVAAWFGWAAFSKRAIENWFAARLAEGWQVAADEITVSGFPSTFETRLTGLMLADPATELAWTAPEFTLRYPSWDLSRITAIWPPSHMIASPDERLTISAERLSSTLDVRPSARMALDASQTRMQGLSITSSLGWQSQLAQGQIDMIRQTGAAARYDMRFSANDLVPAEQVAKLLDPAGVLPQAIPVVSATALVDFDRPWDISAIEDIRPQPTRIDLSEARAEWGALMLRLSGMLDIDAEGRPTGEIAIRAQNWPEMLAMAERAGLLPPGLRPTAESALGFLAGLSGRREDLDVTLRLDQGFVFLGPLPVGEGPRIRLR